MSRPEPFPPRETKKPRESSGTHRAISAEEIRVAATGSRLDADLLERLRLLDQAYCIPQEGLGALRTPLARSLRVDRGRGALLGVRTIHALIDMQGHSAMDSSANNLQEAL